MRIFLSYIFVLLFFVNIFSQEKPEQNNQLENTEIVIEKYKKITFPELNKQTEKANVSKKQINTLEPQKYNFQEHQTMLPNIETKIKVPAIKDVSQQQQYPHFVRLGIGNYLTTYAEGYIVSNANKPLQASLNIRHLASAYGPVNFSGNSQNVIKGEARYHLKKHQISTQLGYQRTGVRFYARQPSENQKDTIFQAYNHLFGKFNITKIDTNATFKYEFNAKYNFLNSKKYSSIESDLVLNTNLSYKFDDFKVLKIDLGVNLLTLDQQNTYNRSIYHIRPVFEYIYNDKLTLRAGFGLFYSQDSAKNVKNVTIFPQLESEYSLSQQIKLFGILSGGLLKNSYLNTMNENPFLSNNLFLAHTNQKINILGGIKGSPIRYLYTQASIGFQSVRNLMLYAPSISDSSRFNLIYDNGTIFNVNGEIRFQKSEKFSLGLKANYYNYTLDNQTKAWMRPNFELAFLANYQLSKRMDFYLEAYSLGGLYAKNFISNSERNLPVILDLNLKTNYKLNDRLSVYAYVFNILGNKFERFVNYPVKSINFIGGLTFSF